VAGYLAIRATQLSLAAAGAWTEYFACISRNLPPPPPLPVPIPVFPPVRPPDEEPSGGTWVCVEYTDGYYYPDTGEYEITNQWSECYWQDEM
jgi:hypothetical protein